LPACQPATSEIVPHKPFPEAKSCVACTTVSFTSSGPFRHIAFTTATERGVRHGTTSVAVTAQP
jgi:hypothetical protein